MYVVKERLGCEWKFQKSVRLQPITSLALNRISQSHYRSMFCFNISLSLSLSLVIIFSSALYPRRE
jgi:hypothetical protein